MLILNAYEPAQDFTLEADLVLQGKTLCFEYALTDPQDLFLLPKDSCLWQAADAPRMLQLWETTCFEAFLQAHQGGQRLEKYYEFNFSLKPAWNGYEFSSYRKPFPLSPTDDFVLEDLEWIAPQKRLIVRVKNLSPFQKFSVGLSAVMQEKNQNKHYCSTAHNGPKPDFHLAENFTLIRGA